MPVVITLLLNPGIPEVHFPFILLQYILFVWFCHSLNCH